MPFDTIRSGLFEESLQSLYKVWLAYVSDVHAIDVIIKFKIVSKVLLKEFS